MKTIYNRSNIRNPVIAVFANKIDLIEVHGDSESDNTSPHNNTTVSIQEEALSLLEKTLATDFPGVSMCEISISYNINMHESVTKMG